MIWLENYRYLIDPLNTYSSSLPEQFDFDTPIVMDIAANDDFDDLAILVVSQKKMHWGQITQKYESMKFSTRSQLHLGAVQHFFHHMERVRGQGYSVTADYYHVWGEMQRFSQFVWDTLYIHYYYCYSLSLLLSLWFNVIYY